MARQNNCHTQNLRIGVPGQFGGAPDPDLRPEAILVRQVLEEVLEERGIIQTVFRNSLWVLKKKSIYRRRKLNTGHNFKNSDDDSVYRVLKVWPQRQNRGFMMEHQSFEQNPVVWHIYVENNDGIFAEDNIFKSRGEVKLDLDQTEFLAHFDHAGRNSRQP